MTEQSTPQVEKSFIEKQTDAIMARVTKSAVPLPSAAHIKKAVVALEEVGEATIVAKTGVQEFSDKTDKKPFVPQPHLTQRPFKNKTLYELRDQLRKTR